jgi:hypothetical protein
MATKDLYNFLSNIQEQLALDKALLNKNKYNSISSQYRGQVANLKAHDMSLDFVTITATLQKLVNATHGNAFAKGGVTKEKRLNLATNADYKAIYKTFLDATAIKARSLATKYNQLGFDCIVTRKGGNLSFAVAVPEENKVDVFTLILKLSYKDSLPEFYKSVLEMLGTTFLTQKFSKVKKDKKTGKSTDRKRIEISGNAFELEHLGNNANIVQYLESAAHEAFNAMDFSTIKTKSELEELYTDHLGSRQGPILEVIKNLKGGFVTVSTELGSSVANSAAGGKEGRLGRNLQAALTRAIDKLEKKGSIADMPGSDSLSDGKRKKTIKATMDPFKKIKSANVRVEMEDIKIKGKISKATLKIKKTKGTLTTGKGGTARVKKEKLRPQKQRSAVNSPSGSPLAMITQFNSRLPQAVEAAMGSPALNYQTGRFASSVRVVDAVTTPQGFTSYGYTYQLYPYQTFEPGYAQGSVERDPRPLIDGAMRDIAIEFAIARFYTRRV